MSGASRILSGVCGIYREAPFTDDGALEWLYTTFIGLKNPWNWTYKTELDIRTIPKFVEFIMETR
jgi:hypothetical protein